MPKKIRLLIIVLICVSLLILQYTETLPKSLARLSTLIYVNVKYKDKGFKYHGLEFSPQFDDYLVYYQDKEGKVFSFTVTPKFFPVIVLYDPLDRPT